MANDKTNGYNPHKELVDSLIDEVSTMNMTELIKSTPDIYEFIPDLQSVELKQLKAIYLSRAADLGDKTAIRAIMTGLEKKIKKNEQLDTVNYNRELHSVTLDYDAKGEPKDSINNFYQIMLCDPFYRTVRYNLLTNQAEVIRRTLHGECLVQWSDTEDATSRNYIEMEYHLYSIQKHTDALRMLFKMREYHPIMELVDNLKWDGENRVEHCLTKWMNADDSEYTQEVSRLIFAGGINRLYNPGCKFDDVPVLIGTKQGEGKSTFIKWLAINEQWFTEIKRVEGSDSVEALFGAWICEIPELSAFKKSDDVESIKAYITRTKDKYRKPYDRSPEEYPRRCIFIGTTNSERFLTDKSGNRRFYPVLVHSSGYDLFNHEEECKEYILQCWAEAKERYKEGKMPPFADYRLLNEYQQHQDDAMEDDWRVGKISAYLDHFAPGTKICAIRIYKECINPDSSINPKPYESREIGQIMGKMKGWEKLKSPYRDQTFGNQRGWIKAEPEKINKADELPF